MSDDGRMEKFQYVKRVESCLTEKYPFMRTTVSRNYAAFGDEWASDLDVLLERLFGGDEESLQKSVDGYANFAIDAIRLQKRFEKERRYIPKSYDEAAKAVYHNAEYMLSLYLPGILLSHFLWPHHYRQRKFFEASFLQDVQRSGEQKFYDVGVGTGYYSRLILEKVPGAEGRGLDISEHSRRYAEMQVRSFGLGDRYRVEIRDVMADPPDRQAPFLVSVEVLEHLENPLRFLKALRRILKPGGKAFITAAITAPNEDHIYLYNSSEEVLQQLKAADFKLEQCLVAAAYAPRKEEPVPIIGAYVVV